MRQPKAKMSYIGELYGVRIESTPYLPYIYKKVKKHGKFVTPKNESKENK